MFQWNRNIFRIHLNGKQQITNNQQQHVQEYTKKIHEQWILNKFGFFFFLFLLHPQSGILILAHWRYCQSIMHQMPVYFVRAASSLLLLTLFECWCHNIPRLSIQNRVSYALYFTLWDCSLSIQSSIRYVVNCHRYNCTLEAHIRSIFFSLHHLNIHIHFMVFRCASVFFFYNSFQIREQRHLKHPLLFIGLC